jgi:hypothetical protein
MQSGASMVTKIKLREKAERATDESKSIRSAGR